MSIFESVFCHPDMGNFSSFWDDQRVEITIESNIRRDMQDSAENDSALVVLAWIYLYSCPCDSPYASRTAVFVSGFR
jgi:hypothetical protein